MSTDDTMRRIEEALEILIDRAAVGRGVADQRVRLLATIRAALQPQGDVRVVSPDHAPDAGRARFDFDWGGSSVQELTITATESDGTVTRFVPQPDDAEHERAVEAWAASVRLSDLVPGKLYEVEDRKITEALRLMRWQPKTTNEETTDGK